MTAIEKAKLQASIGVIALSMMWCTGPNVSISETVAPSSRLATTPQKIEVQVENEKKQKKMEVRIGSRVKKESARKAKRILNQYLDKKDLVDLLVITNGNNIEEFGNRTLHVDLKEVEEGQLINKTKGIQIIIAEEQIDEVLPGLAMSLNQHFRSK